MQTARIEGWHRCGSQLRGRVYGHPKIPDGTDTVTSRIKSMDLDARRCETQNTIYTLGRMFSETEVDSLPDIAKDQL